VATTVRNLRRPIILVGLIGCQGSPATLVDLQLDVRDSLPSAAASVRICITDGVSARFAAASGSYAVSGLAVSVVHEVTVDVMDLDDELIAKTPPILLNYPYNEVELDSCDAGDCVPCTVSGEIPAEGEWTQILGVRFLQ
jgi:hypothetical protein